MSGATAFDYDSARRIARAVHGFERLQGDRAGGPATTRLDIRQPLVKTPTTLPGGYDGTAPLTGTLVERLPDDTILEIAEVYIKNADNAPLEANKIYIARSSGHATVSSVARPLYLVDAAASSLSQNLDLVIPWRILPITYLDSEWFPGGGTYDTWVYVQDLRYFEGSAGVFNPRVDLVREPNDAVFSGNPGALYIAAYPHIMPLYTVDGSNSSANWKAASFAMSWYMRTYGWRPALLGKFVETELAYYTYSGVNYPVRWNYELLNDPTFFYAENLQISSRSFEADLKYENCTVAGWNDPSGYLEWDFRIAGPTQKKVKVYFSDRFRLLNTSNTGVQRCLVTPSWYKTIKTQTGSASAPQIPVSDAQTAYLISQVRHNTSPAPSTTPVE